MSANEALELLNTYIIATKEAKIRNTEYKYSVEESSLRDPVNHVRWGTKQH